MAATAACAARRTLLRCSTVSRGSIRTSTSIPASAFARQPRRKPPSSILRVAGELSLMQSLMPFYSATASALLTSKLSMRPGGWASLSEGFATPL
ncbi:protein NUCLEAR FUSION DEFECTIVE 6, chloroplastic/mitochondrial-like [Phalaenopsis equestris]|uniref:protein NUCLEAR FUSION DEFECTIVE 6, chloroplastic/mitochondrial-like n=1 Tax=Phalaenopsis equestris TaxID=78828 RepID=UPI0009E246D5|nr:protein NUCLEAR FUSION DEFECTIVE 6, chloroplastic/mitochondrial-like [Phalaenopsis equestris]